MIRARKRFGQHFLHDPGVLARIVAAIDPKPDERIVEIGPGLGALTRPLLERCRRIEVIEIDRDVIPELQKRCAGAGELVVHEGDVLEFDIRALAGVGGTKLARTRPCATKSAIHRASLMSVLRPGTFLMCIAFMSNRWNPLASPSFTDSVGAAEPDNTCQTGFQ